MLGIGLYSAALAIALFVWVPLLSHGKGREVDEAAQGKDSIQIEFSADEFAKLKETKEVGELVDKAGGFIKRKLEERKNAEQDAAGQSATAE